jgi:hypothetical protein
MKAIFLLLLLSGCSSEEQPVAQAPAPLNDAWVMPKVDLGDNQAAQPEVVADDYDDSPSDGSGGTPPSSSSSTYPSAFAHPAPTADQNYADQMRAQQQNDTRLLYQHQRDQSEYNRQLYQNQRQQTFTNHPRN